VERSQLAGLLGRAPPASAAATRIIEEDSPDRFMAAFSDALTAGGDIFLTNPAWRARERGELARVAGLGRGAERGWLMIPSGGSGGGVKFARHDGWTVAAAVEGFRRHFAMDRVNSLGVLPMHHVSGFMGWMRSALTGGTYLPWAWKDLEAGILPGDLPRDCCLSLVPTQLHRLLASGETVEWLRRFRVIFVGGGPAWSRLLEEGARHRLPLSPCYGATETAAMAAALRPEDFLRGVRGCGPALPHARIDFVEGVVRISGESLFRGYFPEDAAGRTWVTEDMGGFNADGSLVILGRQDSLIVTGGKKVAPMEVEAALRESGEFDDVAVIGLPDPEWGEMVVACHPGEGRAPRAAEVEAALSGLAAFKRPKRYLAITPWPRNEQGKIDRASLARLASGA
jgi:O-succinylbenzoic acid--CoA ligase